MKGIEVELIEGTTGLLSFDEEAKMVLLDGKVLFEATEIELLLWKKLREVLRDEDI